MAAKRGKETVRDMVLSLAAIGAVVAGIYVLGIPNNDSKDPVKTVDYRVELDTARRVAPYAVAAPPPGTLPKGWRATSVTYSPTTADGVAWHLGFLTADKEYVAVEQSDGRASAFLGNVTQNAHKTSRTQSAGGRTWVRYEGEKYDALVRTESGVTTVVTGTASFARLGVMADALDVRKGPHPKGSDPKGTTEPTGSPSTGS